MTVTAPTTSAGLSFTGRNPDVLTCIANLSNDEVFTPPELANQMLDLVADAWAQANDGANIWEDPTVTFLDPATKSGVFLREITKRLVDGLADEIPDLQERVDHILTTQVFGIGITELTAMLARRSLYCSKHAKRTEEHPHSIATGFDRDDGNIWFERTEHTWAKGRCKFCRVRKEAYERSSDLETHAYVFIHTDDIKARVAELFGDDMQFDVIIGNPPYQLGESGGDSVGNFAMPIYQRFVDAAKNLDPKYAVMITPSRWFAGGRGLDEFRSEMLADRRIRALVDFPDSRDAFAGVDIAGGVSYFLWDSSWNGRCEVESLDGGSPGPRLSRYLDTYDVLVRRNEAVPIVERVVSGSEDVPFSSLADRVSPIQPFSIRTKFRGEPSSQGMSEPVLIYQAGGTGYIERSAIPRNESWVDEWKVFLSRTASEHGGQADKSGKRRVFSRIEVGGPGTACTETFLVADRFSSEDEAVAFAAYLRTMFVRFLVSLRTNTQDLFSGRFAFVPILPMDHIWTDEELYAKYGLTDEEIAFIESVIRPMDLPDA